jgi:cytochrome c oxidase subunit 2
MAPTIDRRRLLARTAALGAAVAAGALLARRSDAAADAVAGQDAGQDAGPRVIPVVARKFVFVPDEIVLTLGETVVLELTAPEVMMGFAASDFGVRADVAPGLVTRLRLNASKLGRFQFNCDVFCGGGHEDMDGFIEVRPAP